MLERLPPGFYRKRGIIYVYIFDVEFGRRVPKSTGVKDVEAAVIRARELERIAADPRAAAAERTTLADAIMLRRKALEELVLQRRRSEATLGFYDEKATRLVEYFEHELGADGRPFPCTCADGSCLSYRPLKLSELQPPHGAGMVDAYIGYRRSTVSDHSIAKELAVLRPILKLAKRRGKFSGDLDEVLPIDFSPGYRPVKRWLTPAELLLVLGELLADRAAQVAFMVATGAELGALQRARDDDVGTAAVHVPGTKGAARDRVVPIVRPWQEALLEIALRQAAGSDGVLFAPWVSLLRDLKAACERAGIPPCSPNDLRRTFATWLRSEGYSPHEIAPMMGHVDSRMVERVYGRLEPAQLAALMLRRSAPGSTKPRSGWSSVADMAGGADANPSKEADPAGFEPAAFGFVVRDQLRPTCRQSKRNPASARVVVVRKQGGI